MNGTNDFPCHASDGQKIFEPTDKKREPGDGCGVHLPRRSEPEAPSEAPTWFCQVQKMSPHGISAGDFLSSL